MLAVQGLRLLLVDMSLKIEAMRCELLWHEVTNPAVLDQGNANKAIHASVFVNSSRLSKF